MKRRNMPVSMAGCYTLDLYCDRESDLETDRGQFHEFREFPHTYTAEYGSQCRIEARRDGWMLHRDSTATCPMCSGKPYKPVPASKEE